MLLVPGDFPDPAGFNMRKNTAMMGTLPTKRRDASVINYGPGIHPDFSPITVSAE
jgi:hypothetical protein